MSVTKKHSSLPTWGPTFFLKNYAKAQPPVSMQSEQERKWAKTHHVSSAHQLIWWGSDATSEGIYNFIVDIKFMMVSDCFGVQVPYLSTTRRDVPKEWLCLTCSLLLVFCHWEPNRCHMVIWPLRGHGSRYWCLPEDCSEPCGLEVWAWMPWDSEHWKNITCWGYG